MKKLILFFSGILIFTLGFGQNNAQPQKTDSVSIEKPFTIVEQMPTFEGGNDAMFKYIQNNIIYPPIENGVAITGTSYVTFVIEKNGSLSNIKTLRGVAGCSECDKEAIRVVKSMSNWNPGKQNGRLVRVQYNLPIKFALHWLKT